MNNAPPRFAGWAIWAAFFWLSLDYQSGQFRLLIPLVTAVVLRCSLPAAHAWFAGFMAWLIGDALGLLGAGSWTPYYFEPSYYAHLGLQVSDVGWDGIALAAVFGVLALLGRATPGPLMTTGRARRRLGALVCLAGLVLMAANLLFCNLSLIRQFAYEPPDRSYTSDGFLLIKTLYHYKAGENYYQAFRHAMDVDARTYRPGFPDQSLRPPLHMWLLSWLPHPVWVPFALWAAVVALSGWCYKRACRLVDPLAALLVPSLLGSLWLYECTNSFVMIPDATSGMYLLAAAQLLAWGGFEAGVVAFAVCFFMREFAAVWLVLTSVTVWVKGPTRARVLSVLVLGLCLLLYAQHQHAVRSIAGMDAAVPVSARLQGTPAFAYSTLIYGTVFLPFRDLLMPVLALGAIAGLRRFSWRDYGLAVTGSLLTLLAFCKVGQPGFAQYYAGTILPTILWGAALAVASLVGTPREQASLGDVEATDRLDPQTADG